MAELKRKDEELTTADLAGRAENARTTGEDRSGPRLVRDESGPDSNSVELPPSTISNESAASRDAGLRDTRAENETLRNAPGSVAARTADIGADYTGSGTARSDSAAGADQPAALFGESEVGDFRSRWGNIQTGFVDEPRKAVEDADNLVASLMKKLAEGFANERERLEKQWDRGDNVSTEDLRIALQRYRSFFDRLLKV